MKSGKKPFYCALWPIADHVVAGYVSFGHQGDAENLKVSNRRYLSHRKTAAFRAFRLDHKMSRSAKNVERVLDACLLEAFAVRNSKT